MRYVTLRGSFTITGKGGFNRFHFSGRLRGQALPRGPYTLTARPRAVSKTGVARTARFKITA